jgi:2-keto-3-deoxy-L-rhamnonate aldolase RhmA
MSTTEQRPSPLAFRQLRAGEPVIGTFVKTPIGHATEILGDLGFVFVVIDKEHAPFDHGSIDAALIAAWAVGTAGIVGIVEPSPSNVLSVLENGAVGVLVPHLSSAAKAREITVLCRYRGGKRGFSNTTRAGRYGGIANCRHIEAADTITTVIVMIDDPEAIGEIDAIAAVKGIDGLFIGRGDLTVAMGASAMDAAPVREATERILSARKSADAGYANSC